LPHLRQPPRAGAAAALPGALPVPDPADRAPAGVAVRLHARGLRDRGLPAPQGHQGAGGGMSPEGMSAGESRIGMIWAQARGGVIGAGGTMPWHLPEDLAHFSRTTKGAPVVMGRRTWESFPPKYRPLPGRTNIVITSDDGFAADGAVRARDLADGLRLAREVLESQPAPTIWVIGGGRVYREAMAQAEQIVVTEIDLE